MKDAINLDHLGLAPFAEFIAQPVSNRDLVLDYLTDARSCVDGDQPEAAIWRLEEALRLLRGMADQPPPAGCHYCIIEESEWVKTPRGGYLELTLKIVRGPATGRRFVERLTLQDPNPVPVEMAYRRLSIYSRLTGIVHIQDPRQLHGIPFWVWLDESGTSPKITLLEEQEDGTLLRVEDRSARRATVVVLDD